MAPLSNSTSPVCCSEPPCFGPCTAEVNSFWLRMYMYDALKCGPPSVLLPLGYKLTVIPNILKGYEMVYVLPFEQSPVIMPTANCLGLINDTLKYSSVLLQAFSADDEVDSRLIHLPFPIDRAILDTVSGSKLYSYLSGMTDRLNMNAAFGYLSLIKTERASSIRRRDSVLSECVQINDVNTETSTTEDQVFNMVLDKLQHVLANEEVPVVSRSNAEEVFGNSKFHWVPFELCYGIPLFHEELNLAVCDRISEHRLLTTSNSAALTQKNRQLVLGLLDFILTFGGRKIHFKGKTNAISTDDLIYMPTQPVCFCDGNTTFWSIRQEL